MVEYLVEMDDLSLPLDKVDIPQIRITLERISEHLKDRLARLDEESGELSVVFVIGQDGSTEMTLRGNPEIVNEARDLIGEQDILFMHSTDGLSLPLIETCRRRGTCGPARPSLMEPRLRRVSTFGFGP